MTAKELNLKVGDKVEVITQKGRDPLTFGIVKTEMNFGRHPAFGLDNGGILQLEANYYSIKVINRIPRKVTLGELC